MLRIRKSGRLYRLLHGQNEADAGTFVFRKGRLTYSFEDDKFKAYDHDGVRVFFGDDGMEAERWLIENGWTRGYEN